MWSKWRDQNNTACINTTVMHSLHSDIVDMHQQHTHYILSIVVCLLSEWMEEGNGKREYSDTYCLILATHFFITHYWMDKQCCGFMNKICIVRPYGDRKCPHVPFAESRPCKKDQVCVTESQSHRGGIHPQCRNINIVPPASTLHLLNLHFLPFLLHSIRPALSDRGERKKQQRYEGTKPCPAPPPPPPSNFVFSPPALRVQQWDRRLRWMVYFHWGGTGSDIPLGNEEWGAPLFTGIFSLSRVNSNEKWKQIAPL